LSIEYKKNNISYDKSLLFYIHKFVQHIFFTLTHIFVEFRVLDFEQRDEYIDFTMMCVFVMFEYTFCRFIVEKMIQSSTLRMVFVSKLNLVETFGM